MRQRDDAGRWSDDRCTRRRCQVHAPMRAAWLPVEDSLRTVDAGDRAVNRPDEAFGKVGSGIQPLARFPDQTGLAANAFKRLRVRRDLTGRQTVDALYI